ncbi:MAG: ATP-binding protein [Planctomycetota bacterium]
MIGRPRFYSFQDATGGERELKKSSIPRILLVEDDEVDQLSIKRMLALALPSWGIRCCRCLKGAEAELRENQFTAILCDLALPDSIGLETLQKILQFSNETPTIVLTGVDSERISLDAISAGAQDYLSKSLITPELAKRAIQYAIQRQEMYHQNSQLMDSLLKSRNVIKQKNLKLQRSCETAQEFVGNVSHEFRTPLTVIQEYASILADGTMGEVPESQLRMLQIIGDRASDLSNMVDDMLDISKLESGLLSANRQRRSVVDIIEDCRPALEQKASVRDIDLKFVVSQDLPEVFCDVAKAGRVLINLAVNALKFASSNVTICVKKGSGCDVIISVSDDGPGIPANNLDSIFKRFTQLGNAADTSTKGFGLGLNIVNELVAVNLGVVRVDSEEGTGSTFTFTLPMYDEQEVARRFLGYLKRESRATDTVALVEIMTPGILAEQREALCRFLLAELRQNDLLLESGEHGFLILASVVDGELNDFLLRLRDRQQRVNRNRFSCPLPSLLIGRCKPFSIHDQSEALMTSLAEILETEATVDV